MSKCRTTHHLACDCREEMFAEMQKRVEELERKYLGCVGIANKHAGDIIILRKQLAVAVKALEYYAQSWHNKDQELSAFKSRKALKQIEEMGNKPWLIVMK